MKIKIHPLDFANVLEQEPTGAKILTIITLTYPQMSYDASFQVSRLATRNVILGANYESVVNRHRLQENEEATYFHAQELWAGATISRGHYLVQHKKTGLFYFVYLPNPHHQPLKVIADEYRDTDTNEIIPKSFVIPFLKKSNFSKRQGLNNPVAWRTLMTSSLKEAHYQGNVYQMVA